MLVIYPDQGTRVLGTRFGKLLSEPRNEEYPHTATMKIIYTPDGWCRGITDYQIQAYYSHQIEKRFGIRLHTRSLHGAHISIIRGRKEKLLKNHQDQPLKNRIVTFQYSHEVFTNGDHWWLNVRCDSIREIREHFGLEYRPRRYHLTIGRYEGDYTWKK
jgi:hypothetical protein